MKKKPRANFTGISLLARLCLILVMLVTLAPPTPTGADPGSRKGTRHKVERAPVEPERRPTKGLHLANNIKPGKPVDPKLKGIHAVDPIDMKLLVIAADGNETDFPAIKAFLNQLGIPYDTLIATQTTLAPSLLWDGDLHGYYQGIVLTTGNLVYESSPGVWISAFDDTEWQALWEYEAMFKIRQVTSYTLPAGPPDNYGLQYVGYVDTTTSPLQANLTADGQQLFSYLNQSNPVTFRNAWVYLGRVVSPTVTTPLLVTSDGYAIASITQYPDGRQNLTVTAANNPYLVHSLTLSYGLINWVTKGMFLGERRVNMDVQVDDLLIDDDVWDTRALTDTTGLTYRISGTDFQKLVTWQTNLQKQKNTPSFMLDLAFNGEGSSGIYPNDTLTPAVRAYKNRFNWVNHTYSHPNLDYITHTLALQELRQNNDFARKTMGFSNYFGDAFVQPDISGTGNADFMQAARDFGLTAMITDTSRPGGDNPSPNSGYFSTLQPSILIIPRRPTNLFYNLTTPDEWVSEYNCYYGPTGTCADGAWRYWDRNLTYGEILDKESDVMLQYLLKWDLDPLMFHQANLRAYDGSRSLLTDLLDATLAKYNQLYSLPVRNLTEHSLRVQMARRMDYDASGIRASLIPCTSLTLTVSREALIPVTGVVYGTNVQRYGGEDISYVQMSAGQSVTIPLPACSSVTLTPSNDSYVAQGQPNASFGAGQNLLVRSTTGGTPDQNDRTLVQFSTFGFPATATLLAATLRLYMSTAPSASRTYDVLRLTGPWTEETVNWSNQPAGAATATSAQPTGITSGVWIEWDVTADVRDFVNLEQTNFGWGVKDRTESESASNYQATFRSKEYAGSANRPQLVVVYAQ